MSLDDDLRIVLFDLNLKPSESHTYSQLRVLADETTRETPVMFIGSICRQTGKSRSTLFIHMGLLRAAGYMISKAVGSSQYQYKFPEIQKSRIPDSNNDEDLNSLKTEYLNLNNNQSEETEIQKSRLNNNGHHKPCFSEELTAELEKAGVYRGLYGDIEKSGMGEDDLFALLRWSTSDWEKSKHPDKPNKPGGLFISRLRGGGFAPDEFYGDPCPECGGLGKHQSGCREGYRESWGNLSRQDNDEEEE